MSKASYKDPLVPVRRIDVNGRAVTRWVRSWEVQSNAAQFPQPTILSPSGKDVDKVRLELSEAITGEKGKEGRPALANLDNLSGETIELLMDVYQANHSVQYNLSAWVFDYGNVSDGEAGEHTIRELATYYSAFSTGTSLPFIDRTVGELAQYRKLPYMEDYSRAEPELKSFIHGLLSISDDLYSDWFEDDEDSVPLYIQDEGLVDLIFEYPEKVEVVRAAIKERNTQDVAIIRAVLENSETNALSQGAL